MKHGVSYYSHKGMPDGKFESGNFSIFGDITSQNLSLEKGMTRQIRLFTPGKWVKLEKVCFYVQNRYPGPKIDSPCQQFSGRGFFFISKVFDPSQ